MNNIPKQSEIFTKTESPHLTKNVKRLRELSDAALQEKVKIAETYVFGELWETLAFEARMSRTKTKIVIPTDWQDYKFEIQFHLNKMGVSYTWEFRDGHHEVIIDWEK